MFDDGPFAESVLDGTDEVRERGGLILTEVEDLEGRPAIFEAPARLEQCHPRRCSRDAWFRPQIAEWACRGKYNQ